MKKLLFIVSLFSVFTLTACMNDENDNPADTENDNNTQNNDENQEESYDAGTYKVGVDLSAGEYYLVSNDDDNGKLKINECDESCNKVLVEENFSNNYYVSVEEGDSLTVNDAKIYPIEHAPMYTVTYVSNTIEEGMYKIGTDIPSGSYMINDEDATGYYRIQAGLGKNATVIEEGNFSTNFVEHLNEGEYIIIKDASMYFNVH